MKLFILQPVDDCPLWEPWYDKAFGMVVRAKNEKDARFIASKAGGAEDDIAWLSPENSTCIPLLHKGEEGVIIVDVARA